MAQTLGATTPAAWWLPPEAPPTHIRFRMAPGVDPPVVVLPVASGPLLPAMPLLSSLVPTRVITSVSPSDLAQLELRAATSAFPPEHSLGRYWDLVLPEDPDVAAAVVSQVEAAPGVEVVWVPARLSPPGVTPDLTSYQGYLGPATGRGIEATWLQALGGGSGAGVSWIDIEGGWLLQHEDLPAPVLLSGVNDPQYEIHGTNVLGVIAAKHNGLGVAGIAPDATLEGCISIETGTSIQRPLSDAILEAITRLPPGSVLVVEEERVGGTPVELENDVFDAIRLASALGIIVVEPAGNSNTDLDTFPNLSVTNNTWRDSGAILVGAAWPSTCQRLSGTCWGSRVNAWGWCAGIATTGGFDLAGTSSTPNQGYTALFGMTSGATAMVAGAAIALQGFYQQWTGLSLTPLQMRQVLPAHGTPAAGGAADGIGTLPNLQKVVTLALGYLPDLYLRDRVGDTGDVPSAGNLGISPDLLEFDAPVPNPQLSLGEGSFHQDAVLVGGIPAPGVDHHLYVRVRNRGLKTALKTSAQVFWTVPATMPVPALWKAIGTTTPQDVPDNDQLTVLPALLWPAAAQPANETHCLLALVGNAEDPVPLAPPQLAFNDYVAFVANNNNVAWRNIVRVPDFVTSNLTLRLVGDPLVPTMFDLELWFQIPAGSQVELHGPMSQAKMWNQLYGFPMVVPSPKLGAGVTLPPQSKVKMPGAWLPAGLGVPVRIVVTGPASQPGNVVVVRQYHQGKLVGAVHFRAG